MTSVDRDNYTAIELLGDQHREIEQLFDALTGARDFAEKQGLFDTLADKLIIHSRLEERFFYPAVRERQTEGMAQEASSEHASIKRLLAELLESDPSEPVWASSLIFLKQQVEAHFEEEEEDLFPVANEILDSDELLVLAQEMASLQGDLERTDPRHGVPELIVEQPTHG